MQIGLYIHIPFCKKKCNYCNFYSVPIEDHQVISLCDCLIKELKTRLDDSVDTIYIGGGSPSCIGTALIDFILQINEIVGDVPEFTVEVNPHQASKALFKDLAKTGVNRISIGAQSFVQSELDLLGRNYQPQTIIEAVHNCHKSGIANISLDLIYAIPDQTLNSWDYTLSQAMELPVKHISAYALSYENGTPLMDMFNKGDIKKIDDEIDRMMYDKTIDTLRDHGFSQYEISNFAIDEFQCLHNLKYWDNDEYLGIGPAAGSYYKNQRTINVADVEKYMTIIQAEGTAYSYTETPNDLEFACQSAVLGLRKTKGIRLNEFYEKTGYDFMQLFEGQIEKHSSEKLLLLEPERVRLSRNAFAIADPILADFSFV